MFARKAFSLAAHLSVASYHVTFVREVSSLAVHLSVTSYHVTCLMISVLTGKLRSLLITLRESCGNIGDSTVELLISLPDVTVIIAFQP